MKRKDLINICERAVVPFSKWHNRDSNAAQINLDSVYKGLKAGIRYTVKIEPNVIWVRFIAPTQKQLSKLNNFSLPISSIEEYREKFGYEDEMFDGEPIDFENDHMLGYLPTNERLNNTEGGDWY